MYKTRNIKELEKSYLERKDSHINGKMYTCQVITGS